MVNKFIKDLARKFLPVAKPAAQTLEVYRRLRNQWLGERTFYFGERKFRAACLQMESAPGTAEVIISELTRLRPAGAVLDFGCGQHKSEYLKALNFNIHSCDIFDFNIPNYTWLDPASPLLPFQDKQFEITVMSEVAEHVESPFELLKQIARVTSKSILMTTPNPMSKKSRNVFARTGYLYWFEPTNFSYHTSPIFAWQVELFCKRHNWHIQKILGNHSAFALDNSSNLMEKAEALIFNIAVNVSASAGN